MRAIARVKLGPQHQNPGRTKHLLSDSNGVSSFPPFVELVIACYPGDSGYYLMHHCADGTAADTHHETIEQALHQAEWEFGVKPEEWATIDDP